MHMGAYLFATTAPQGRLFRLPCFDDGSAISSPASL